MKPHQSFHPQVAAISGQHTSIIQFKQMLWLCLVASLGLNATAQTPVCGTINTATWTPVGNPYIIGCDSTVPTGQTLTIQPGVIVWMGSNVALTVNGAIQCVGTPEARISFQQPTGASYHWNRIHLNYNGTTNRFKYCDFQNADTAISMRVYGGESTMIAEIYNSTFVNCTSAGIYGESRGLRAVEPVGNSYLKPLIKNCNFQSSKDGCVFLIWGQSQSIVSNYRSGFAHPVITANVFSNLTGSALSLTTANFAGGGQPVFVNNTLINCRMGVDSLDPWNAIIQNNIFVGCTNAAKRTGSLSLTTSYNAFHENAVNFSGYPPNYGAPTIPNRNGTMADLFFNIFENPQFVGENDLRLATGSPCIDAGTSGWEFTDMCFPPGQGTAFPDLGAYGGPDACNWLEVVPLVSTTPWMSVTNNTAFLNWDAIPRSSYRIEYLTNAIDTHWKNLVDLVPLEKRNSRNVTATNSERHFRIQSLGRTPGN